MAAAKAEVKKEEDLSLPEYFMRGAKKGFYITVELIAPAMVMAYTLITFLNLSGIMPLIGKLLAPVMGIFGLPGEASVVLLAAFFAKAAGCATAAGMYMIGHFARIVLVCKVRALYYPVMFATPIIDAVIVMFLTRLVLVLMGY